MHTSQMRTAGFSVGCIAALLYAGTLYGATLQLTDAQLLDRIKGGWLAKTAGGALGGPAEGSGSDQNRTLPGLSGGSITDCGNDDVYAQIPFLATMATTKNGANGIYTATMQDYGAAFKKTTYALWCGNAAARNALNAGINAPYCGGWPLNGVVKTGQGCSGPAAEDIDWSIECQWIGFITPGLPATCFTIDSICGHVIGYANGLYAGTFFDVASSIAPLYTDIHTVVKLARNAIPPQCDVRKNIDMIISYHDNNPTATYWDAMNWAFGTGGQTKHTITDGGIGSKNNTTIVAIALLWGDGDMINTVTYAVRMGQDTDCNCGDACAIMGSLLGYANLPQQWRTTYEAAISGGASCSFSGTGVSGWTYLNVLDSTVAIAKKCILQSGGSYTNGVYTIQVQDIPQPKWFEEFGKDPQSIDPNAVRAVILASKLRGPAPLISTFDATSSIGQTLKYTWKFGDGSPSDTHAIATHTFQNIGTYSVYLVVTNGTNTDSVRISIVTLDPLQTSLKYVGTPIVSVTAPSGQGSRDLLVIKDDVYPTTGNYDLGYDTYNGGDHTSDYFGYTFTQEYAFSLIVFHFSKRDPDPQGGVFENGFSVEVRNGGVWSAVAGTSVTPSYNAIAAASFDSFSVSVPNALGDGIRIIGAPRGSKWVGCSELDIYGKSSNTVVLRDSDNRPASTIQWRFSDKSIGFRISNNNLGELRSLEIVNLQGEQVFSRMIDGAARKAGAIQTPMFAPGMYLVRAGFEYGEIGQKIQYSR